MLGFLSRINREKQLIDEEIELYRKAKMVDADATIVDHNVKVAQNLVKCREQLAEHEHEFHSEKEQRGIELAKLRADVEALENIKSGYQAKLEAAEWKVKCINNEVERVYKMNELLIGKLGVSNIEVNYDKK